MKVQFPWDRQGKNDANSSCWVRVATPWAGKQWGIIHIPRVGQEVVVDFEEGDPDRPIIVGSVYNAENMPPYTLPDNKTQSGYLSRSTLQGTAENFNELRFEDKKDSEEIYFHAEKDFNRVVENNDTLKVGFDKKDKGDQTIQIFNNQGTPSEPHDCDDGSQTSRSGTTRQYHRRGGTNGRQPDDQGLQQPDADGRRQPGLRTATRRSPSTRTAPRRSRPATRRSRSRRATGRVTVNRATTPTRSSRATATSRSTWATTP